MTTDTFHPDFALARVQPGLPVRTGVKPLTTDFSPHVQLDQQPASPLTDKLLKRVANLAGVTFGPSRRAPPGAVGLYICEAAAQNNERAFLLGAEFAHVHPGADASLHLILPEPLRTEAIVAGWAEPHPAVGQPTVSPDTVMVYAPRNESELDVVAELVAASWRNASGG